MSKILNLICSLNKSTSFHKICGRLTGVLLVRPKFNSSLINERSTTIALLSNNCNRNLCTRAMDANTNVQKDVILFKYENPRFYNIINIFGICQFTFWGYLSHFAFTTLKDAPVESKSDSEEALPWYRRINLGENKYRNTLTIGSFAIGYGILATAWLFTLRSVRYLILRKGGKEISLVTYAPFNKNRIITVPLNCISAQESRQTAKVQLPLKVKNKAFYYILDMRGEFKNTTLFDYTAGLSRKL